MVQQGLRLDAAYSLLASRRPGVCINPGFMRQLGLLEELMAGEEPRRALGEYR
jgi:hypothetical protein